jgi:hypothetical protein
MSGWSLAGGREGPLDMVQSIVTALYIFGFKFVQIDSNLKNVFE